MQDVKSRRTAAANAAVNVVATTPVSGRACVQALLFAAIAVSAGLVAGCGDKVDTLRAFRATSRHQLVGGPVAYADIGDFVLENDKVRVAILDAGRSWGPGVFGGSLVDADVRRADGRFASGQGHDRLAEIFPFANLLVPAPLDTHVSVPDGKDGSDGKEAVVRVEGRGMFFLEALGVLRTMKETLNLLGFRDVNTFVDFRTDYLLRPGDRFVTMRTWLILPPDARVEDPSCKDDSQCDAPFVCKKTEDAAGTFAEIGSCSCAELVGCDVVCDPGPIGDTGAPGSGFAIDAATGCATCKCSTILDMQPTNGDQSVFGVLLGDLEPASEPEKAARAGVGAGDFVFFGNQNDIFIPGMGFDEEKPVWDAFFAGRDTFTEPLTFDFVAAAGGDVSYGYFTARLHDGDPPPRVEVPLFTSATTAFLSHSLNCNWGIEDDATCETSRVMTYERYLAIGEGDIASAAGIMHAMRGTQTGTVAGMVRWRDTVEPAVNATVFLMRDPNEKLAAEAQLDWHSATLDELIVANRTIDGTPGVLLAIDADLGLDPVEDGDFEAEVVPGRYIAVATDQHRIVTGDLIPVEVKAGARHVLLPSLPTPARVRIQTVDGVGKTIPAKATLVRLGDDGKPLYRDGGRRPYFGQGRLGVGVQHVSYDTRGRFDIPVPEGRYRLVVSHGVEYGIHDETFVVAHGDQKVVAALLMQEVDTSGWIGGDFHLHQKPSFDSGMEIAKRVLTVAGEGIEYAAATDHDVATDFAPAIQSLNLEPWLQSAVGSEISTLEIGHYIGFPLKYTELSVPEHGSPDWYCLPSDRIIDRIFEQTGFEAADEEPTSIIAHPRDGFLGWASQMGMNPYSLTRKGGVTTATNPILRTVACEQDALEVFNGKRFDLIRTPTVWEVQVFGRCLGRIDAAGYKDKKKLADFDAAGLAGDLAVACPELDACRGQDDAQVCPCEAVDGAGACTARLSVIRYAPGCAGDEDLLTCLARCQAGDGVAICRQRYRTALAEVMSAEILRRTAEEQRTWLLEPTSTDPEAAAALWDGLESLCKVNPLKFDKPLAEALAPSAFNRPCYEPNGMVEDYFRFLEHGFVKTIVGGSDSHSYGVEPGTPRNFVRSSVDDPQSIDRLEMTHNLRDGHVVASYGPMIDATIDGKGPGDTATVQPGKVTLHLRVQTASWFAVDRVEVTVNGLLQRVIEPAGDKKKIVDLEQDLEIDVPQRDSWVVVTAMGIGPDQNMRPVSLDEPFGSLQLAMIAAKAFGAIPGASLVFAPPPRVPDFFPVRPYAITNAILLDTDGNGSYDAPLGPPAFCSPRCNPADATLDSDASQTCADVQSDYVCLQPERRCGLPIAGVCDVYETLQKTAAGLGTHAGGHVAQP